MTGWKIIASKFTEKKMETSIVVRKYADLKPFFEEKAKKGLIKLNNQFITEIETAATKFEKYFPAIENGISKLTAGSAIIYEIAKANKIHFEAILTPEMKKAMEIGIGGFQQSHKVPGDFHTMFQWKDGHSENITLRQVKELPNYSNMALLMNQMQMQQTMQSIQNILMDFAEETYSQLNSIQQAIHDDRIKEAEIAKRDFETFLQEGTVYETFVLHSNNTAFVNLELELKRNLEELEKKVYEIQNKRTSIGTSKLIKEEQKLMNQILETLNHFQILSNIETYMVYIRNENNFDKQNEAVQNVQRKYSEVLLDCFTEKRLKILSGLCTLPKDIWRETFMPGLAQIKQNNKELLICQNNVKENFMVQQ